MPPRRPLRTTAPVARAAAAILLSLCAVAAPARAQPPAPAPDAPPTCPTPSRPPPPARRPPAPPSDPVASLEGRPIASVTLQRPAEGRPAEAEPLTGALEQLARNQIRSTPGTPLSAETVSQDISRLNRIGRFRSIRAEARPLEGGAVALVYTLTEQPVIEDVQVVGNRELSDQEILSAVETVIPGAPVDRFNIDRGARQIEDLYRARGYSGARVHVDQETLDESAIVIFRVIEGQPIRVTLITFAGNNSFTDRELRSQIKTATWIPILEKAPLDSLVIADDIAEIARFYRDRGHLDIRVAARTQPSPDGREVAVAFEIDEGPLYTLRSVEPLYVRSEDIQRYKAQVLGDPQADVPYLTAEQMRRIGRGVYDARQIAGLMSIKPGDVYSEARVRQSIDALRESYGKLGYLLDQPPGQAWRGPIAVRIDPTPVRDERRPEVDLILLVEEGVPTLTGNVAIIGNTMTKQQVVMRQVQVRPERPLDKSALDDSQRRLEQLRLFEPGSVRYSIQPPAPADPHHRDVVFEVAETNTGQINFGAEFGSDAGVIGRFSIVQRNFDPLDVPQSLEDLVTGRAFRGAGQTLTIEALPGTQQQQFLVSLAEPYFLESNFAASGTAFYRRRDLREYDEERYGGQFVLGRRFGTLWVGNLAFRNQWIQLGDIDDDAAADIFEFEDQQRLSAVGLEFTRTTTDNRFRPTKGSRIVAGVDQAGALGGDFDFTRLGLEYTGFFNLYESFLGYKTILKIDHRMSWIPQGQDSAPVYERLYLGGTSFRGFAYRGVAPLGLQRNGQPSDDAVGGSWLFFLGAEVNQPVYKDILGVVGFVDTGTVETDFGFSQYRVSVGVGVRLYVRQLSPVPLAFDFGFPILKEDGDRERLFTFSVDVPF